MYTLFINWNPSPSFELFGFLTIRYYSLLFVTGLMLGYYLVQRIYKREGLSVEPLEKLSMYVFLGILIGARLGHCLFYEPGYYLSNPLEMLLPIRIANGSWEFIGYQGLASHGGGLGIIIAVLLYKRKNKLDFLWFADRITIVTALTGAFIRLGNLMNSEIVGDPTDVPWAFVFERLDNIPRHPAQLYEAIAYLISFGILFWLFWKVKDKKRDGFIFGLFFILIFSARFIIEFFKRNQVNFEEGMLLNMGQLLSIPFIVIGVYLMIRANKPRLVTATTQAAKNKK